MNESKNVRKNVSMMFTGMVIGAAADRRLYRGRSRDHGGTYLGSPSLWMVSRWKWKPTTLRGTTM